MGSLQVISAGFHPTIQDLGRPMVQHLGVPASGAMDLPSLRLANRLVGNPETTAAIEIRLVGPTLEVTCDSVRLALAGSRTPMTLLGDDGGPLPAHKSVRLTRGQRLRVPPLTDSAEAYLAVEGGFDIAPVYGSLATFVRAGFGGFEGRALADGDLLPLTLSAVDSRAEVVLANPSYLDAQGPIRVVLGPQDDFFTAESIAQFFNSDFTVGAAVDRMGMRLEGPAFVHSRGHDIISDGIALGAIQVPGNGQPIILLADHQTTGGYPKVGTVISADVPRLGRLRPGQSLQFQEISAADGERAAGAAETAMQAMFRQISAAGPQLDLNRLQDSNLISGVIRAGDEVAAF